MKRRILLVCVALGAMLSAMAQRHYTFNAVALNVDGLPGEILGIEINDNAKEEAGATELCKIIANSGWDIVGFSEDFNFHSYLVAAPASNYYNFGVHGGTVSSTSNSTDGLGFACNKRYTMNGGDRTKWSTLYGGSGLLHVGDNGADGMIDKGFRFYTVTLATGIAVDVYVLHMDASTADSDDDYDSNGRDKNIVAREAQLKQLADAVVSKMKTNKRPVIIMGDTNCRYTREAVKTGFIDYIEADSRFTVNDPWVDLMWNGVYPTYGNPDMTTNQYGDQKGEIVDKIFYINTTDSKLTIKANSYLHDTEVAVSEHYPVVVNFTLTDPNGTPLTNAEKENNWTLDLSDGGEPAPTFMGVQPEDGKAYFLKNVSTGLYLKWGADYGARGILGSAGVAFTFKQSGSKWILKTSDNTSLLGDPNTWLDNGGQNEWTLEVVPGTEYQYYIRNSFGTLSPLDNDALNRVNAVTHNANDDRQKWVLLTPEKVKTEMLQGNGTFPYDVTPLFRAADFDRFDDEYGIYSYWTGADAETIGGIWWQGAEKYNGCAAIVNTTRSTSLSQTIKGMPAGTYKISFEAFYRERNSRDTKDQTNNNVKVTIGGQTFKVAQNNSTGISTDRLVPGEVFRDNDTYAQAGTFTLNTSGNITFTATNPSTTGKNWVCLDNIKLVYSATGFSDPYLEYKQTVMNKVNETYEEVKKLNAGGQAAYDITVVVDRFRKNQITSPADATAMCDIVDAAYANAYAAHRAYIVEHAFDNLGANGDISVVIENPSFETGDLTGWTVLVSGNDTRVADNLNALGMDGKYLFNTWADGNYGCGQVLQEIKGLRNGYYTLQAMVTSWADRKVYIVGNNQYTGTYSPSGDGTFVNLALDFLVENGVAQIGAVGGNKDNDFYYKQGIFFKVDHFRLAYKGEVGEGRVKIALADAKAKAAGLNPTSKAQFEKAVAKYENATVSGDGKTEETAIYDALKDAIATQPYANTDMTWVITNPSFETGDWTGWTTVIGWDTKVAHATDGVAPANGEGQYIVNTWNDEANATNSGVNAPVYQKLTGLPNGRYRLTADVASDGGNQVCAYATVGSNTVNGAASPENNWTFVKASVEFEVTGNADVTIGAVGLREGAFNKDGGCWYKCDNFRLTYLGHEGTLSETTGVTAGDWYTSLDVTRSMKGDRWNTFVVPFDMAIPVGWTVKKLKSSEMKGDVISLTFVDASSIEAGVPYMVKVGSDVSSLPKGENVQVSTELNNPSTNDIEFVGVYEAGEIPVGAFFISENVFYQAADETNTIKAFRAYFQPKTANARALNYRFDGEEGTTGIEEATEEVTVVGIYTLGGVRINDMQDGVNILKMSNGTTMKVIIK